MICMPMIHHLLQIDKNLPTLWGGCSPDPNTVLFYWVCDSASPYSILANIVNSALTITIWAVSSLAFSTVLASSSEWPS